jgi:putative cell wall-binding protein
MLRKWNILLYCFSVLVLTLVLPSIAAANDTSVKTFSLNTSGENEILLDNGMIVSINMLDEVNTKIKVARNNSDFYYSTENFINVEEIAHIESQDNEYLLFINRYDGSGGSIYFSVLKLQSDSAEQIYVSPQYQQGKVTINSNIITVTGAVYEENDPRSTPSKKIVATYELGKKSVVKSSEQITDITPSYIQPESKSSNFFIMSEGSFNPPAEEISRMLTEKAIEYNIPPEIVKAIAWSETNWLQFREYDHPDGKWKAGDPVISHIDHRGIGIMQVTKYTVEEVANNANEDIVRLKNDIEYNIETGIKILKEKWNYGGKYIPIINDGAWDVLDHWYFAILAYNGMSYQNDPNHPDRKAIVYQDRVYNFLELHSEISLTPFPIEEIDVYYKKDNPVIRFDNKLQYDLPYLNRKTHHGYVIESWLQPISSVNLRTEPSTEKAKETVLRQLPEGEIVEIAGEVIYDTNNAKHYVWYPIKTQNGETGFIASSYFATVEKEIETVELSGKSRYDTAIKIANEGWQTADTIILANGFATPDALTGSVLAKKWDAPLLLTHKDKLPEIVREEIKRLNPKKIYILGGHGVISKELEEQLLADGIENGIEDFSVIRIGGQNRLETAALIAEEVASESKEIIIAAARDSKGNASPDALSVAPYAGSNQIPIFLTDNKLPKYITDYISKNNITKVTIIGGTGAVSTEIEQQITQLVTNKVRIAGKSRFDTSLEIAKVLNIKSDKIFFARGDVFVDALSATPLAARENKPIILIKQDKIPEQIKAFLDEELIYLPKIYFLGGNGAIAAETRKLVREIILDKFPVVQQDNNSSEGQ